jgi:hypothetical protein
MKLRMGTEPLEVSQLLYILISYCKNINVAVMRIFQVKATLTLTRGSHIFVHFNLKTVSNRNMAVVWMFEVEATLTPPGVWFCHTEYQPMLDNSTGFVASCNL